MQGVLKLNYQSSHSNRGNLYLWQVCFAWLKIYAFRHAYSARSVRWHAATGRVRKFNNAKRELCHKIQTTPPVVLAGTLLGLVFFSLPGLHG